MPTSDDAQAETRTGTEIDWNAVAARVTAFHEATGSWGDLSEWLAGAESPPEQQGDDAPTADGGSAAPFTFLNDPRSTVDTSGVSFAIAGDTIVLTGAQAVNLADEALPDLGLLVPFAWPRVDNPDGSVTRVALDWDNEKDGWFTPDFEGTGTSLLVTLHIATPEEALNSRIAAGSVAADETLTGVLGPTSTLAGVTFPEEMLEPGDLLPFVDLGGFAPEEAKPFDLVFTYHWGDGSSSDALRTAFAAFTLAPVSVSEHDHLF
jgi:hypothetical protein